MAGHIKLGLVGALRDYNCEAQGDGIAWDRGPASPFAAKVNSSGPYDKVDIWNEWVQEDWQTGIGRVDPEAGGFLYGEIETRVPNQLILPPLVQQCDTRTIANVKADCRYMPNNVAGTLTVGSGGYNKVAMTFTTPGTLPDTGAHYDILARVATSVTVTISIYTNNAGSPDTLVGSNSFTGANPAVQFFWYGAFITNGTLSTSTQYWLVIEPANASHSFEVAYGSSGYDTVAKSYNGSAWADITSKYFLYTTSLHRLTEGSGYYAAFIRFNSVLYTHTGEALYKYDSVNEQFDSVGTITGTGDVTSVAVFGPTLYFGRSSGNYTTMNTSEAFSAASTTRKLFLEYKGYLYSTWQNDLYYSVDGSTWSSAFVVGGDDSEIRGMAGMGDSLYMATDKALFRFAPGEIVEEVTRFGSEDSTNGVGMMEYQGRLYIPAGGRLFRFDPSGQMMDIWVSRDDDLPSSRIGTITGLARMNNWLVAYVLPSNEVGWASLWVWQEEGWHFLANSTYIGLPATSRTYSPYYDRSSSRFWFTLPQASPLFVDIEDYTLNPYNSATYLYQPYGWLQQDRFFGGQKLLAKSWESVTVSGDNLSANVCVKVYWQDEGSTGWELLGTADSDGEELRWSDHSTRPDGKWIKLGLLLQTNDGDETPRVRAVTVKFLPYPNDRIRDTVTLTLKDYIEGVDGALDAYTLAQQKTHIESLINSVDPIIYEDPFDVQYEVTIVDWRQSVVRLDYYSSAQRIKEMRTVLVLEQIPEGTYSA